MSSPVITRRQFLTATACLTAVSGASMTPIALAQSTTLALPKAVDVVKIMSFSCPVCRESEAHDRFIAAAVQKTGGRFVRGPVPSSVTEDGAKEHVYYASRTAAPDLSERLVELYYKGLQDLAIPLDNLTQVYVYLQQQLGDLTDAQLNALFAAAQSPESKRALSRAASLAYSMGVEAIPSYILIVDNNPVEALAPNTVGTDSLSALRDAVISAITTHSR